MYTFLTSKFKKHPATKPPKPRVAAFLTAFFIAFECFSGTSYGLDINIMGKFYGVI